MPTFEKYHSTNRVRCIIAGISGSGKSTLLASLANAGYRTCVVDLDGGLDILDSYLTADGRKNLHYESISMADPVAWTKATNLTLNWKTPSEDLGRVDTWKEDSVLVIDSATFWAETCQDHVLLSKGVKKDDVSWNIALRNVMHTYFEDQIARLSMLKCNVILNTHLKEIENKSKQVRIAPEFFGKVLPDRIPKYFNDIYVLENRKLLTKGSDIYPFVKCSAPQAVAEQEEPDLAAIFHKIVAYRNRT
tara:strand:- start:1517 stop:2260 length:744 start_codon:yes stop_codon:yes gene_type:complete